MTALSMYRGDDREFTFTLTDSAEVSGLLDLTAADVRFTASQDGDAVIEKDTTAGITVSVTPEDGTFTLAIDAADTEDLPAPVRMAYDIEVTRDNKTRTVVVDTLEVLAEQSRPIVP